MCNQCLPAPPAVTFLCCLVSVYSVCLLWPRVLTPSLQGFLKHVLSQLPFPYIFLENKQTNKKTQAREMTWFSFRFYRKYESYLISPLKAVLPWMISPTDAMKPRFCVGLKRAFTIESVQTLSLMNIYWVSVLCPSLCEELVSWLGSLMDDPTHLSAPTPCFSLQSPPPCSLYKGLWRYLDI